ncbi:glycosyl hydrolase family 18 protein [Heliophilum fasciatum]|uniref:Spore germination protein n=1 Tax=Heliophilum fasciatum TaxID=35700 RepID=A0A4R2RCP2_9FIRM|nr:glycosyl hydrolase family 18 protein [Heliophilum fasciatum]MCW2279374.1 spore germination protein [Heliophilum fasciatum]TCP60194.1 spore germination protein [Heliophilum fasciatum]
MQIHVVRPGDSLWSIAQAYRIPLYLLIQSNEVPNPAHLVVGQTLVIPTPGSSRPRTVADVGAYVDPRITGADSVGEVDQHGDQLTYLPIFSYAVNPDGTLTPVVDQPLINAAYRHRVAPLLTLTNFINGRFDRQLATTIFTNEALQEKVLDEVVAVMREKSYHGLNVDFEYLGAENRERYNQFLRRAAAKLKPGGFSLSTALAPKTSGSQPGILYEGHDYAAQGQIVDFIFFMTYEWGWSGGPPRAVSPINLVRQVLEYAISVVPRNKILMGIPLYGYDWTLPFVPGGRFAESISPQQAIERAARYNSYIQYDRVAQAPFFFYTDENRRNHEVWFEDARSIQAKFDLVKTLGIRGFYYWVLGKDFPQNWLLIQDNFIVRKVV